MLAERLAGRLVYWPQHGEAQQGEPQLVWHHPRCVILDMLAERLGRAVLDADLCMYTQARLPIV